MRSWVATLAILAVAAALKLAAWAYYGPVYFNDTHLYESFADYLLHDDWSWQYRDFQQTFPVTMLRTIGYPAIIAAAKIVAGDGWQNLVAALQISASLVSLLVLVRWTRAVCQSTEKALLVGLAVAAGQVVLYDLALLPDSLFASLTICTLCALTPINSQEGRTPDTIIALTCGLAVSLLILLRANGLHLVFMFLPLALVWIFTRDQRKGRLALLLILPVVITAQGYILWNQHRSGERFFSSGGQIAAFQPLYQAARRGADLFSGDSVLDQAVRATTDRYAYGDIYALNEYLADKEDWSAVEIQRAGEGAFLRALIREPGAMIANAARNFGFDTIRSLINPARAATETHHLITGDRLFPGFSKMVKSAGSLDIRETVYVAAYGLGAVLSILVFLAFLLGVPVRAIAGQAPPLDRAMAGLLWAGVCMVLGYYSFIHLEQRYVLPVTPFVLALGIWALPERRVRRGGFH